MKRIFILAVLAVLIPFFIVLIFNKDDNKDINYKENIIVRVKHKDSIEKVLLEDYVLGVLAGEMPYTFPLEAIKAQAVASRTYVLKKIDYNKEYDVTDDISNQVFISLNQLKTKYKDKYNEVLTIYKKAINDTLGEYITYNDSIITAFFFSTSYGYTDNSEDIFIQKLPYLRSVDSSWDQEYSPVFLSDYQFSYEEFFNKLGIVISDKVVIKILEKTDQGRTKSLSVNGNIFKSQDVRTLLGLKSSYFDISSDKSIVYIKCRGYGHNVGMSQYGAYAMAKKGYKYSEILKYYYNDIEIKKN